jgi:hypothetical protein
MGSGGDGTDERLGALGRRKRGGLEREARPRAKRGAKLESGDGEAGDHTEHMFYTNVCSVSTPPP